MTISEYTALRSLDDCSCPCHHGSIKSVHIVACCTGISKYVAQEFPPLLEQPNKGNRTMSTCPPDQDIIDQHTTPGLRKNELTRSAKRAQLIETQRGMTRDEIEALLDKLYGHETKA